MSEDVTVQLYRAGSIAYSGSFVCQIDKMSPREAEDYGGAEPHFTYNAYTTALPMSDPQLVRQSDLLIDQKVIDAVTNKQRQYRVISDPEFFSDGHVEMVVYRYRGR